MKFYLLADGENGNDLIVVEETKLLDFGITEEMATHLDEVFPSNGNGKITTWFKTKDGEQLATLFDVEKKCFDVVPF